jgi:hypothetical protein
MPRLTIDGLESVACEPHLLRIGDRLASLARAEARTIGVSAGEYSIGPVNRCGILFMKNTLTREDFRHRRFRMLWVLETII